MPSSESTLVDYITSQPGMSQSKLAEKIGVSRAQVSKWKAGDHMSFDRTKQLLKLAGLFDTVNVEWALFAKTEENAQAWYAYVQEIAEGVEWGDTLQCFVKDEPEVYVGHILCDLCKLGAEIDPTAPTTMWIDDVADEDTRDTTPLASAIYAILEAWGQLHDWLYAFLQFDDLPDNDYEVFDCVSDLEWLAFDIALESVKPEVLSAISVDADKLTCLIRESRQKAKSHLQDICSLRSKYGLSITADYFQLLYLSPVDLGEKTWFIADGPDEYLIRQHLPYGQQQILLHQEYTARALNRIEDKLDAVLEKLGG